MSTGTLYPIFHGMERKLYLRSLVWRPGKTPRRLKAALGKVRELYGELLEE